MQESTRKLWDAVADLIGLPNVQPTRKQRALLDRIASEYYHDFVGVPTVPQVKLVLDLRTCKMGQLVHRVQAGEFDATREEAEAWARSAEGQHVLRVLMK